jgi:hypothetical protein
MYAGLVWVELYVYWGKLAVYKREDGVVEDAERRGGVRSLVGGGSRGFDVGARAKTTRLHLIRLTCQSAVSALSL